MEIVKLVGDLILSQLAQRDIQVDRELPYGLESSGLPTAGKKALEF